MIGLVRRRGQPARTNGTSPAGEPTGMWQSLADGEVAGLVLAIEDALTSRGSWNEAEAAMSAAWGSGPDCSQQASLFAGAPALAFALDTAGIHGRARWARALAVLDQALVDLVGARLVSAESRAAAGAPTRAGEFDLMDGMTGLAVVLLRRATHARAERTEEAGLLTDALAGVLAYLVDRASDRVLDQVRVPGWWTPEYEPGPAGSTPLGGHADLGMAHGGAGILAVLAAAHHAGITVPDQDVAIRQIAGWYDRWQQRTPDGVVWWPQRLSLEIVRTGHVQQTVPPAPAWVNGTPGIGRALQMGAIALGDQIARVAAEDAIASCITPRQLSMLTAGDLWAGSGGMYLTVLHAAGDSEAFQHAGTAVASMLQHRVGLAADAVSRTTSRVLPAQDDTEFLHGQLGSRLVFESLRARVVPVGGADGALGIGWVP